MSFAIKIFKEKVQFASTHHDKDFIANNTLPEIVFAGKSNVGKSSLINSLCYGQKIAKTSNTPGQTRQINFFSLATKLLIVDLPGYGYAKVPDIVKLNWQKSIILYLKHSMNIKLVNLLVDSRRGIKENDLMVINILLNYNLNWQLILTKYDKREVSKTIIDDCQKALAKIFKYDQEVKILCTSSKNGTGLNDLRKNIIKAI